MHVGELSVTLLLIFNVKLYHLTIARYLNDRFNFSHFLSIAAFAYFKVFTFPAELYASPNKLYTPAECINVYNGSYNVGQEISLKLMLVYWTIIINQLIMKTAQF